MMNRYRHGGNRTCRQPNIVVDIGQAAAAATANGDKGAGKPDISDKITDMSDKPAATGRKIPVFRKATGAMSDILPKEAAV